MVFGKDEHAIKKLPLLIQNHTQQECGEHAQEQRMKFENMKFENMKFEDMKFEDMKFEHDSLTVLVAGN